VLDHRTVDNKSDFDEKLYSIVHSVEPTLYKIEHENHANIIILVEDEVKLSETDRNLNDKITEL
jgi:hypothetical protein